MADWKIIQGDVLEVLDDLDDESFDGCFCDPPYGLSDEDPDMNKVLRAWMENEEYDPSSSAGFMGMRWDQFPPGPKIWSKVKRCVKPGANVLSFTGTRTSDLISLAMRMSGLIRKNSIAWQYGSGFPKSHDISKNIDRKAGAEREVVGEKTYADGDVRRSNKDREDANTYHLSEQDHVEDKRKETAPATSEAEKWDGWGTALKPSREDVIIFRKPREKTYVHNAQTHGVAGFNIDGARIGVSKNVPSSPSNTDGVCCSTNGELRNETGNEDGHNPNIGRWPTNTVLGHHPKCEKVGYKKVKDPAGHKREAKREKGNDSDDMFGVPEGEGHRYGDEVIEDWNCHPDCAVRRMDESSGERSAGGSVHQGTDQGFGNSEICFSDKTTGQSFESYNDEGGASRFFYTSKAQKSEREAGLLELKDDPDERVNTHPCIKPIDLCEWIATLILPPPRENGERKILVPFSGTGSEVIGCLKAGWDKVIGIEINEEYCEIARKRIEWWEEHGEDAVEHHKSSKKRKKKERETGQENLFDG